MPELDSIVNEGEALGVVGGVAASIPVGGGTAAATSQILHVRHEAASGTDGGALTASTWNTRTLNTVVTNEITGASLASNQVTLPVGTYEVQWFAQAYTVDRHQSRLQNITAGTTISLGSQAVAGTSPAVTSDSPGFAKFTLAGSTVLALQHNVASSNGSSGQGRSNSFGTQVYGQLIVRKVG